MRWMVLILLGILLCSNAAALNRELRINVKPTIVYTDQILSINVSAVSDKDIRKIYYSTDNVNWIEYNCHHNYCEHIWSITETVQGPASHVYYGKAKYLDMSELYVNFTVQVLYNNPPMITKFNISPLKVKPNQQYIMQLTVNDDTPPLVLVPYENGQIKSSWTRTCDSTPCDLSWTISKSAQGIYSYYVLVYDAFNLLVNTRTVQVNVSNVYPVFTSVPPSTVQVNTQLSYDAEAVDSDGDLIIFYLLDSPSDVQFSNTTGLILWTPSVIGTETFSICASDGCNCFTECAVQTFSVNVVQQCFDNAQPCAMNSDCCSNNCYNNHCCPLNQCWDTFQNTCHNQVAESAEIVCSDGLDNDCDGFIDCKDQGCDGQAYCEFGFELTCNDNEDNDGDLLTDCGDPDCTCTLEPTCIDNDGDGYGANCTLGPDCNDNDSYINVNITYFADADKDGFGNPLVSVYVCPQDKPLDFVTNGDDCNDNNAQINPNADETCDGIDNNCIDGVDEGCACIPGSIVDCSAPGVCYGFTSVCSSEGTIKCDYSLIPTYEPVEVSCDGLDNDCDNKVDALDGLPCCVPGSTKACTNDPDCPGVLGTISCVDRKWDSVCQAECGIIVELISPRSYYLTCGLLSIPLVIETNVFCEYSLNSQPFKIATNGAVLNSETGVNTLVLSCAGKMIPFSFTVEQALECGEVLTESDAQNTFVEQGFDKKLVANALNTPIEQKTEFTYKNNQTIIKNTLIPKMNLTNFTYALYIPKCLAEYLDQIEFDYQNYEIIKDDPLIAWHFAQLNEQVDFTYKTNGEIDPDCLKQIQGLPIADLIKPRTSGEINFIVLGFIMVFALVMVAYYEKFKPVDQPKMTEKDYQLKFIINRLNQIAEDIRSTKPRSSDAVKGMMMRRGYRDKEIDYVLNRLKFK